MKLSCCINTYKRPVLLKKLLDSLNGQILSDGLNLTIIVVDNSPDKEGERVVDEVSKYSKYTIEYYFQPEKNISLTRNLSVKKSKGEYILFIDDDEYAEQNWINNLYKTITKYKADAVFGRLVSYFDEDSPDWVQRYGRSDRPTIKTGNIPKFFYTGNCIIKSATLKSIEGPFDTSFGLTGGEDTLLFGKLLSNGAKYVFCKEAIVYEYFPKERANLKWLLRRGLRTGNTFARRVIKLSENKIKAKVILLSKAIISIFVYIFLMILTMMFPKYFLLWTIKLYRKFGHIMAVFNIQIFEYAD